MVALRRRLYYLLIVALSVAAGRELEEKREKLRHVDMGYDDCPVCLANRQ